MAIDIPQWYFWVLLGLSLVTIPLLIYNYIKHHKEKMKIKSSFTAEDIKRVDFKLRGNISGKRQAFTLVRDPFRRVAAGASNPTTLENLTATLLLRESTKLRPGAPAEGAAASVSGADVKSKRPRATTNRPMNN